MNGSSNVSVYESSNIQESECNQCITGLYALYFSDFNCPLLVLVAGSSVGRVAAQNKVWRLKSLATIDNCSHGRVRGP